MTEKERLKNFYKDKYPILWEWIEPYFNEIYPRDNLSGLNESPLMRQMIREKKLENAGRKVVNEEIDGWFSAAKLRPPNNTIVWGIFKSRNVELVKLILSTKEYENYFSYQEGSWYSLESEKLGGVSFWKLLDRPEVIKEEKND